MTQVRVGTNKGGVRTYSSLKEIHPSQLSRAYPSIEGLANHHREEAIKFGDSYMRFLSRSYVPWDVVRNVGIMVNAKRSLRDQLTFIPHKNGSAFALIRPGKKPILDKDKVHGVRVLYTHTDAPCLAAKVNPACMEWDPDLRDMHLGVEIDTFGYGGISPHQWAPESLDGRGKFFFVDSLGRRKIKFFHLDGCCPDRSAHTDMRRREEVEDAFKEDNLNVDTGLKSYEELRKAIGLRANTDFAAVELYFVPRTRPHILGPRFITGYRHDDTCCVFSAVRALLDSRTPELTTIVLGFDKEEVGSKGPGGAGDKFFERVLYDTLVNQGVIRSTRDMTQGLFDDIASKSLAFDADVDVGSSYIELEDGETPRHIDKFNVAKLGYGVYINAYRDQLEGDCVDPALVGITMACLGNAKVITQQTGSPLKADFGGVPSMNEFFVARGFNTINVGIPVAALHSPNEILCRGDLYGAYRAYMTLLEDKIFFKDLDQF
ncbi:MAG: hypothetical protein WC796_04025 [Candidatus Pacearchaeota archaeon]|jgi:aspartyl aminopeptidase